MRQTRTTYRRLKSGQWQQNSSLTAPMPPHVQKFLQERAKPPSQPQQVSTAGS